MKQKQDNNTERGNRANTLLYAVAPQPKLSTDAQAWGRAVARVAWALVRNPKTNCPTLKIKTKIDYYENRKREVGKTCSENFNCNKRKR